MYMMISLVVCIEGEERCILGGRGKRKRCEEGGREENEYGVYGRGEWRRRYGDIFGGLYRERKDAYERGEDGGIYVRISYGGLYRGGEEGGEACGA